MYLTSSSGNAIGVFARRMSNEKISKSGLRLSTVVNPSRISEEDL